MKDSKLILLLKSFSEKEFKAFHRFVSSPFFNTNPEVSDFYALVRKTAPEFLEKKIQKLVLFRRLYPQRGYSEKHMKFLMNQVLKLAERFMAINNMESRSLLKEYYLLDDYVKRGLNKNYRFIFNKAEKSHQNLALQDADFLHKGYLLKNIASQHFDKQSKRQSNEYLQQLVDSFDTYYMANKLKHTCQMLSNQGIISEKYDINLVGEIANFIGRNDYSNIPAVHLYYNIYLLLQNGGKTQFQISKKLFQAYIPLFNKLEMRQVFYFLANFCIRQLEQGDSENHFLNELFTLYQNGVDSKLLLDEGMINPWDYKNAIKLGLRLRRFEETEKFILDYSTQLKEQFKEDAFHYNMAELHYYKKQLPEALEHLVNVEFSDIYYILGTKKLLLKIYFETNEYDALESLLSSFQTYLRRNKLISANVRDTYLNFIKCLLKIIKQHDKETLLEEINTTSPLTDKKWLLALLG